MSFVASGWRPRLVFRWSELQNVMSFGANLTGFNVFNYFARNADNFIIGAFIGPIALGYYSLAYKILLLPRETITRVLTRVIFPAFCIMQDDDARFKVAYLRLCGAIAFTTFPMMLGIAVVARPLVEVVLGGKWAPAVPLLIILAPLGALQSIWVTVGQVFVAKGRADLYFRWGVGGGILFVIAFLTGIPWGVLGVAVAYAAVCVPWSVFSFWLAFRLVRGLSVIDLARQLSPYFWMSMLMGALVASLDRILSSFVPQENLLVICVATGVIIYSILSAIVRPPALYDLKSVLPKQDGRIRQRQGAN